jgi:hypothetical protein
MLRGEFLGSRLIKIATGDNFKLRQCGGASRMMCAHTATADKSRS